MHFGSSRGVRGFHYIISYKEIIRPTVRSYERFCTFDRCSAPIRPFGAILGDVVDVKVGTLSIFKVKSSHLYLYSAFNNTHCVKATAQYQNGKMVSIM